MKIAQLFLLLPLLSLTACNWGPAQTEENTVVTGAQIIGGESVREFNPIAASTVSLITSYAGAPFSVCTGTLISKNLVLTAAHCIEAIEEGGLSVHIGTKLPKSFQKAKLLKIANWKAHPAYELVLDEEEYPITGLNDVALLRLADELPPQARPVPVLNNQSTFPPGLTLLLAGYGLLNEIGQPVFSDKLNAVKVPLYKIWDNLLVTDQSNGKGACSGDSGGPAYLETPIGLVVVGITRGPHDKAPDCRHFGEYTYASKFESFILETAKELSAEPPQFVDLPKGF